MALDVFDHGSFAANEGNVHIPYEWSYADATARGAATGFVAGDVGKLARQLDNNSLWMLTDDSPITWLQLTGSGSGAYTDEEAQDAVGAMIADTSSINLTYTDATPELKAEAIFGTSAGTVAEGNHTHGPGGVSVALNDLSDVVIASAAAGDILMHDGTDWDNKPLTGILSAHFDGGGSALASTLFVDAMVPHDLTVTGWRLVGDGDVSIDVQKDSYANFPPTGADSVAGSEKPALSGVTKNEDTNLTTWTDTTWTKGEMIRLPIESGATATWASLWITYNRTGA